MNSYTKRIIAVITLLVLVVFCFAACKNEEEWTVSVSSDENGSLYYTDPTTEIDGITYGGETHYVDPKETNSKGEYKVDEKHTSAPVTTAEGTTAPTTTTPAPTKPGETTTQPTTTTTTFDITNGGSLSNDGVIQAW